ncbi:origin recognition complex subunit 4 C-terminus-domain-containing protein [Syncephalis fuscata]|nr:origin recognition complex subunit 4 C-terminus-domain-containing protein [Syncephalis fuscata]
MTSSAETEVNAVRRVVLDRLTERSLPNQLVGLEPEENRIFALFERTVLRGESNSALLVGPRSCGKTALIGRVLRRLEERCSELPISSQQQQQQPETPSRSRVLPSIISTPSRQSKRRKTRQSVDELDDDDSATDISLLTSAEVHTKRDNASGAFLVVKLNGMIFTDDKGALRDIARQLDVTPDGRGFSSFAECLQHLLKLFAAGQTDQTRPIIFILDEFDAFAQRPKQTLLYNLFDLAQSGRAPVAVIGLTCRMDVVDTLEKRVKSRFSHRIIHLKPPSTLEDYVEIVENALSITSSEVQSVKSKYLVAFNTSVKTLLKSPVFIEMAKQSFELIKDIRSIFRICIQLMAKLSSTQPLLSSEILEQIMEPKQKDIKMQLLQGVSVLDLCLMVAAKRLLDTSHVQINFAMIFDEYLQLFASTATGGMKHYKREVALKAFERLMDLELILPTEHQKSLPKEYRMTKLALHPYQVVEAVKQYRNCPDHLKRWVSLSAVA